MPKDYQALTRLGRVRRLRHLAEQSLAQFGLAGARFRLLRTAGNVLFRVWGADLPELPSSSDLFEPGQYLLRVHQPGYQEPRAVELELSWMNAMRREEDLPVQEPIRTLQGNWLACVEIPGVPGARHCSLLRWIKGRLITHHFSVENLRAHGRLLARLHNFSARWPIPVDPAKRRFDWPGLFEKDVGSDMPNAQAWDLLSPLHRETFGIVAERIRAVMQAWGEGPEVFGLIHGDLALDANLLFWHGQPRVIDFDDSGYGYWVFDLAVALDFLRDDADYPRYRQALVEGYRELRPLPAEHAAQIELFLAALQVYWNLWATGGTHLYPQYLPEWQERMASTSAWVVRYVQSTRSPVF